MNSIFSISAKHWYSVAEQIVSAECQQIRSHSQPISQETYKIIESSIQNLQKQDPVNLEILASHQMLFTGTIGTKKQGILLINENDIKKLSPEELNYVLTHEWAHLINADAISKRLASMIVSASTILAAIFCAIASIDRSDLLSAVASVGLMIFHKPGQKLVS